MPMLQWNDGLSVGIPEIDAQHSTLVEMVNTLYDSMTQGSDKTIIFDIVDRMTSYAVDHFGTEERYMEEYSYPGMPDHNKEHREFIEKVLEVKKDLGNDTTVISMDILNFLSSWLVTHINGTDKKMGSFLVEQGLF